MFYTRTIILNYYDGNHNPNLILNLSLITLTLAIALMAPSPAVGAGAEHSGGGVSSDVRSLFKTARKERGVGVGGSHMKKAKSKAKSQPRVKGEKLRGTEEVRYIDISTAVTLVTHHVCTPV